MNDLSYLEKKELENKIEEVIKKLDDIKKIKFMEELTCYLAAFYLFGEEVNTYKIYDQLLDFLKEQGLPFNDTVLSVNMIVRTFIEVLQERKLITTSLLEVISKTLCAIEAHTNMDLQDVYAYLEGLASSINYEFIQIDAKQCILDRVTSYFQQIKDRNVGSKVYEFIEHMTIEASFESCLAFVNQLYRFMNGKWMDEDITFLFSQLKNKEELLMSFKLKELMAYLIKEFHHQPFFIETITYYKLNENKLFNIMMDQEPKNEILQKLEKKYGVLARIELEYDLNLEEEWTYLTFIEELFIELKRVLAIPTKKCKGLFHAIDKNDLDQIHYLLNHNENVNKYDFFGETALVKCVKDRQLEIARLLLSHRANVNCKDRFGVPVILIAAHNGDDDLVQQLIERGANVNVLDPNNESLLLHYIKQENLEMIHLLIDAKARGDIGQPIINHPSKELLHLLKEKYETVPTFLLNREDAYQLSIKDYLQSFQVETVNQLIIRLLSSNNPNYLFIKKCISFSDINEELKPRKSLLDLLFNDLEFSLMNQSPVTDTSEIILIEELLKQGAMFKGTPVIQHIFWVAKETRYSYELRFKIISVLIEYSTELRLNDREYKEQNNLYLFYKQLLQNDEDGSLYIKIIELYLKTGAEINSRIYESPNETEHFSFLLRELILDLIGQNINFELGLQLLDKLLIFGANVNQEGMNGQNVLYDLLKEEALLNQINKEDVIHLINKLLNSGISIHQKYKADEVEHELFKEFNKKIWKRKIHHFIDKHKEKYKSLYHKELYFDTSSHFIKSKIDESSLELVLRKKECHFIYQEIYDLFYKKGYIYDHTYNN